MTRVSLLIIAFLFVGTSHAQTVESFERSSASRSLFPAGEILNFRIAWGFIEAGEAQMADAVAEFLAPAMEDRHDLLITHNFVIAWFVREVFGAPSWRWLGLNQANCGLTIIRVRSAKPPVLVTHNDLGHLPAELRTGLPQEQPF